MSIRRYVRRLTVLASAVAVVPGLVAVAATVGVPGIVAMAGHSRDATGAPGTTDAGATATGATEAGAADDLEALVERWVSDRRASAGVAAARIGPDGVEVAFAGRKAGLGSGPPDAATGFEIGSITKVFTGILLADMVERGEVSVDTRVEALFPDPDRLHPEVARITLAELTTHTSGLPRLPMDGATIGRMLLRPGDPYRGTTTDELFDAVAALGADDLTERGAFAYSNLGPALLGRLLELRAGVPYETLLEERVLGPLGLSATGFYRTPGQWNGGTLARPHRENLRSARSWTLDAYAPAGALVSNLDEMIVFLQAVMAGSHPAVARSLEPLWDGAGPGQRAGMGWALTNLDGEPFHWHNGRTGGYHAFVGFLPESGRGVVVLMNASHDGDPVALAALRGDGELPPQKLSFPWLLFTLGLTLAAPWIAFSRGHELEATMAETAARPRGRIHLVSAGWDVVLFLSLTWALGSWDRLPVALWWAAGIASLAFLARAMRPAMRLPWFPTERPWRTGATLGSVAITVLLSAWVVFRL